jgi:hypothetical protein
MRRPLVAPHSERRPTSVVRDGWGQRYTWLGVACLLILSALHWSRGGPEGVGAPGDLVASYGAWYGIGVLLLGLGWWRASHGDGSAR